jgi:transposase
VIDVSSLPADVRALIEAQAATIARQDAELLAHRETIETMRLQLARLRRMQFGRSSEKIAAEIAQLTLALEDLEAGIERKNEPVDTELPGAGDEARKRPARRPLPDHLPRTTIAHDTACACSHCGGALRPLGEDVTEVLDYVPGVVPGDPARAAQVLVPRVREHNPGARAGDADPPRSCLSQPACSRARGEVR